MEQYHIRIDSQLVLNLEAFSCTIQASKTKKPAMAPKYTISNFVWSPKQPWRSSNGRDESSNLVD